MIRLLNLTVFIFLIIGVVNCDDNPMSYRLPATITPSHYKLTIEINLVDFKFSGNVEIKIDIKEPTKQIKLHYKDITVKWLEATLTKDELSFKPQSVDDTTLYSQEMGIINYETDLAVGSYVIKLEFSGDIRNDLKGLYRSEYEKGK